MTPRLSAVMSAVYFGCGRRLRQKMEHFCRLGFYTSIRSLVGN
jgi:hypothetical protein